jgi:hypothetical protein
MHWAVDSRGRIPPRAEGDLVADAPSPRPLAHAAIDGRARFFRFRHSLGLRGGSRAGGVGGERGRAVRKSNERMPRASHVSRDVEVTFAGSESARSRPRRGRFEPPRGPKRAGGTLSGRARDRRGRKPRVRPSLRAETRARREGGSRTSSSSSLSSFEGGLLFPGGATLPSTSAAMFSAPCAEATRACPSERRERVRASTPPCARLALARAARRARTERAEADATRKSGVKKRTRRTRGVRGKCARRTNPESAVCAPRVARPSLLRSKNSTRAGKLCNRRARLVESGGAEFPAVW